MPSHSSPTRRMPKSSRAATLNRSVSVLSSTSRLAGMSRATTTGGSSLRGAIASARGCAPASPSASRQLSRSAASAVTTRGGVRTTLPSGSTAAPSTSAAASSRLAVARIDTVLPLTGASVPPRTSCRRTPGRCR